MPHASWKTVLGVLGVQSLYPIRLQLEIDTTDVASLGQDNIV